MDYLAALLVLLGARHAAPATYHAPVKTLPLVVQEDHPTVLLERGWGPCGL